MVYEFTLSSLYVKLCSLLFIILVNIFGEPLLFQEQFSVWECIIILASKPTPPPVLVKSTFVHPSAQNRIPKVILYFSLNQLPKQPISFVSLEHIFFSVFSLPGPSLFLTQMRLLFQLVFSLPRHLPL